MSILSKLCDYCDENAPVIIFGAIMGSVVGLYLGFAPKSKIEKKLDKILVELKSLKTELSLPK